MHADPSPPRSRSRDGAPNSAAQRERDANFDFDRFLSIKKPSERVRECGPESALRAMGIYSKEGKSSL